MNRHDRRAKASILRREAGTIRSIEQEVSRWLQQKYDTVPNQVSMQWSHTSTRERLIEKLVDRVLLKRGLR